MIGSLPTLMAIDDEPAMLALVERFARSLDFDVVCHDGGRLALAQISNVRPDVVLVDLQMPEFNGMEMLRAIRTREPDCAVILMTGHASIDSAIEAVKLGAIDYLTKPLDLERLGALLRMVRQGIERRERLLTIDADVARQFEFEGMIGRSVVMQDLFDSVRRLAPHAPTVLVTGETGTGKELVARALHRVGPRRAHGFMTVNCSAVVETLFESELFGHQPGAFTGATGTKVGVFEHAAGGTLFLDEVSDLPLSVQRRLLRAVEHGEVQRVGSSEITRVDVRVIGSTNRDLRAEVAARRFRDDLFYRLSIMELHLSPLRARREDIPLLTAAFVRDCAVRVNRTITGTTTAAERALQEATWPGNIRELRNVIERACMLNEGKILTEREIRGAMAACAVRMPRADTAEPPRHEAADGPPDELLSSAQRAQIGRVLKRAGGNKTEAARLLGISRRSLYRWMDRLDLTEARPRGPEDRPE